MTPIIMPSSVRAERSLWAQIAAMASFNVSMNFKTHLVRFWVNKGFTQAVQSPNHLECGDLSPLWSVATSRDDDSLESTVGPRRQGTEGQSGDRSPHSKLTTPNARLQ